MSRKRAHFEGKEASLEGLLRKLRLRRIIKYIPEQSTVIDLGCGYDTKFLHTIQPLLKSGVGVDLSVKPSTIPVIKTINHNLDEPLPFTDDQFDRVVSMANLEHLNKPKSVLTEAYRILKPGGKLILTTPSIYAKPVLEFLAFRLHLVSADEIRDHKMYFNKKILQDYLHQAGFRQIEHHYFQCYMNNFVSATK